MSRDIQPWGNGKLAVTAVVWLMLALPATASAVDDIPFAITGAAAGTIACVGPGVTGIAPRVSGCRGFSAGNRQVFYRADNNLFSPFGRWACSIRTQCGESDIPEAPKAETTFCLNSGSVELVWDGAGSLTSDQPIFCITTLVKSVLGQTGEADDTPARDVDTYRFAGKAGERVKFHLGRDGVSGSMGQIATLRVRASHGGPIAEKSGALPVDLEVILPGPVEVVALGRGGASDGDAFRGYYRLEVAPISGDLGGRLLLPANDVEH
jgi:hypothetical protein